MFFSGLTLAISTLAPMRAANPAALDPTFDGDGKQTVIFASGNSSANSVLVQPDGNIVAAGSVISVPYAFAVARLTPTGALDTTFNSTGTQTVVFGIGDYCFSCMLQTDSKIVLTGSAQLPGGSSFAVARLTPSGALDTTFNTTGTTTIAFPGYTNAYGREGVLQSDGKILVVGDLAGEDVGVVRLNTDGSLDTSFNGTGRVVIPVIGESDAGNTIVLQADGKIIVTSLGYDNLEAFIARLNSDGSLDTSFGVTGTQVIPSLNPGINALALQPDGKILVAGTDIFNNDVMIARLTTSGSFDTSFNGTGTQTISFASDSFAQAVVVQPSGKIVLAGRIGTYALVIRLNTDGSLDPLFNGTGYTTIGFGGTDQAFNDVTLQSDGKIVLAGDAYTGSATHFALARLSAISCCDAIRELKLLFV